MEADSLSHYADTLPAPLSKLPLMQPEKSEVRLGLISALAAYLVWGVFPLFWRQLSTVDAWEVVCHRIIWAFLFLLLALPLLIRGLSDQARRHLRDALTSWRVWAIYSTAAALIAANWLTFIWAVNHQRVLEASLGYYINPLLSVILGVVVLGERLTRPQWSAVAVAAAGVLVMTVADGGLPWPSLVLACSFSMYGFVKKKASLPALIGLLVENAILVTPAIIFLGRVELVRGGAWNAEGGGMLLWLMLGGSVTILPLALFAFAARRIPLSTIGLLQYVAPTLQFLIGLLVFSEDFDGWRFVGFACVWCGLAIYAVSTHPGFQKIQGSSPVQEP